MPTQLPIEETYAHLIFRTEEEKKAAEPKRDTDEFRCFCSGCNGRQGWSESGPNLHKAFCSSVDFVYRRRIDPGPGYRIVGLREEIQIGDDALINKTWFPMENGSFFNRPVIEFLHVSSAVTAFRRKIEPAAEPKQEPKGWVLCSDGKPEEGRPVLVAMAHFRAVCKLINGEWIECFSRSNYGIVTHWMELPKEELPPIKSPDDAAFEEWVSGQSIRPNSSIGLKVWNAALAYARPSTT